MIQRRACVATRAHCGACQPRDASRARLSPRVRKPLSFSTLSAVDGPGLGLLFIISLCPEDVDNSFTGCSGRRIRADTLCLKELKLVMDSYVGFGDVVSR